jgi:hypothetical protein
MRALRRGFRSGRYDIESLRRGEWIVEPGLIYYNLDGTKGSSAADRDGA